MPKGISQQLKQVITTNQFEKDIRAHVDNDDFWGTLKKVQECFNEGKGLPPEYRDHSLVGNWKPTRECHLASDLLLIYFIEDDIVYYVRLGTHSELYRKPKVGLNATKTLNNLRKINRK